MNPGNSADVNDPAEVVRDILAGLLQGADEVLADDLTRQVRAALAGPVTALYAS